MAGRNVNLRQRVRFEQLLSRTRNVGLLLCALLAVGCFPEHDPNARSFLGAGGSSGDLNSELPSGGGGATSTPVVCLAARGEPIPARSEVVSANAAPSAKPVFTSDLFSLFQSNCGGCHVEAALGGFNDQKVTLQNFPMVVDQKVIDAIRSSDPDKVMPPLGSDAGKLAKDRAANDPILGLATLIQEWIAAGRPADLFYEKAQAASDTSPYLMSPTLGAALTNLGNCIADKAFIATESETSKKLDTFFAKATSLPQFLEDTDLVSFDAAELARYGVVPYAPAYPLWTDDARKMRYVRVPKGQSISFDKATQKFNIPKNTRFYKTFFKQVIDQSGATAYKRIETRLIVSRPDSCDAKSGVCTPTALMGTYVWNDDETKAELLTVPLRNGKPFADRLITYVTDEQKAKDVKDPQAAGLTRSYALPGSTRCVQCHMGSVSQSFILGFAPLQIRRRPKGEGGVIEDTGEDELNQLQRLIDYGVLTGIDSEDDIAKLENSEALPPRNDNELTAQGYMLGNCGHCHNPRGFPSVQNPELRDILQFWPDMHGGIFHFPLDRMSPRVHRGSDGSRQLPYITPSLYDVVVSDEVVPGTDVPTWTAKDTFVSDPNGGTMSTPLKAPWRSLVYRNVDTPFTYVEDFAIYPHMPRNTPGYDCRAPRILGDWMVSIPAILDPTKPPDIWKTGDTNLAAQPTQPYLEVTEEKDGKAKFDRAVADAGKRLDEYHAGHRYDFCPDTSDIVDPLVVSGAELVPQDDGYALASAGGQLEKDGVPDRAHWVVADPTEVPGDWLPRRADWENFLLDKAPDAIAKLDDDKREVLRVLGRGDLKLSTDFRDFALHELPLTMWDTKKAPGDATGPCDDALKGEKQPSDFSGDDNLLWLSKGRLSGPVYTSSIGATVFTQICRNCHGSQADGQSTNANTLLDLTGGVTRVADLRDGLFGPHCVDGTSSADCAPGSFRASVFGKQASGLGITSDDLAGRYLAWMAMGGTEKPIPDAVLVFVSNTPAFETPRGGFPAPASANMLAAARNHCLDLVPLDGGQGGLSHVNVPLIATPLKAAGEFDTERFNVRGGYPMSLVSTNGDLEIWERICTFDNPAPVYALVPSDPDTPNDWQTAIDKQGHLGASAFYRRSGYPAGARVGSLHGIANGVSDDNRFPWCLLVNADAKHPELAQQFATDNAIDGQPLPFCPQELLDSSNQLSDTDRVDWSIRGAANAGLSVFAYIDALAHGTVQPKVLYNECDKLNTSGG